MSKVKKLYKYKLKLNDSYMSELAIGQDLNLPIIELPPDMTNPVQNVTPDITNPSTLMPDTSSVSAEVDKEIGLEMSTKLQNLIQHVGDEMYIMLEKCRNDGDYMQIKTTSSALDRVYDMLKFVNYQDISQVDYALLEILKIADEFTIKVPENLQYESIYKVDIVLNDAMDYDEEQKKADYEAGLEKVVTKSIITKDKLPTIRDNFWEGVDNISKLVDKLKEIQDVGNHRFDELIKDLENFNTDGKSDAYIKKLVYNLILRLKFM